MEQPPPETTLEELMRSYQQGDLSAFEELYRRLAPRLRPYLSSLTWNASMAEDLLQETFLQLHRSRDTHIPGRPVLPWAFAVARHVYYMYRRSSARRSKLESPVHDELPELPVPASVENLATRDVLLRALGTLGEDSREAVLLHHVWGMSFREIAALLGIREGTAKVRAHRALRALKSVLGVDEAPRG